MWERCYFPGVVNKSVDTLREPTQKKMVVSTYSFFLRIFFFGSTESVIWNFRKVKMPPLMVVTEEKIQSRVTDTLNFVFRKKR